MPERRCCKIDSDSGIFGNARHPMTSFRCRTRKSVTRHPRAVVGACNQLKGIAAKSASSRRRNSAVWLVCCCWNRKNAIELIFSIFFQIIYDEYITAVVQLQEDQHKKLNTNMITCHPNSTDIMGNASVFNPVVPSMPKMGIEWRIGLNRILHVHILPTYLTTVHVVISL